MTPQEFFTEWIKQHEEDDDSTEEMGGTEILYRFAEDYHKMKMRKTFRWFIELIPQRFSMMDKIKMVRERMDEEI